MNLVQDFIELRTLEVDSGRLDGVNYLCLVMSLMQACDKFRCAALRWNGSSDGYETSILKDIGERYPGARV